MTKKTYKNETALVSAMKKTLEKTLGGDWTKIHGGPYQRIGVSDLIGCLKGRFIAIEVKMPGKEDTLSTAQEKFIESINKNDGLGFMSSDIDYTLKMLGGDNVGKEKNKK